MVSRRRRRHAGDPQRHRARASATPAAELARARPLPTRAPRGAPPPAGPAASSARAATAPARRRHSDRRRAKPTGGRIARRAEPRRAAPPHRLAQGERHEQYPRQRAPDERRPEERQRVALGVARATSCRGRRAGAGSRRSPTRSPGGASATATCHGNTTARQHDEPEHRAQRTTPAEPCSRSVAGADRHAATSTGATRPLASTPIAERGVHRGEPARARRAGRRFPPVPAPDAAATVRTTSIIRAGACAPRARSRVVASMTPGDQPGRSS